MAETSLENGGKLILKDASKRQELLTVLDRVIESAFEKYTNKYTKNPERISWGRLVSDCAKTAGKILNDQDLEALTARIEKLELAVPKA